MGTPPCGQTEGQTRVKTLPSRRTTYVGGNQSELIDLPTGLFRSVGLSDLSLSGGDNYE